MFWMRVRLNIKQLQIRCHGDIYSITTELGETYLVNNIGLEIVRYISNGSKSVEDIVEHISNKYNVSKEEILGDIFEFISTLNLLGLIECRE